MGTTVGIGIQDFSKIIENDYFYVDKTKFIKEWWESGDEVTLITRPRRFGKTLTMSMVEQFFSVKYAGRSDLFERFEVWKDEKFHALQGQYPVISLSFANIKEKDYKSTRYKICQLLVKLYAQYDFLQDSDVLTKRDKEFLGRVSVDMSDGDATMAIYHLSDFLAKYYGRKVIILLDEYDTPMQEAYVNGYWEELVSFSRSMFNAAFKTNPWMDRGIMTGITRVSKESIFSDLNHLEVVTTTSDKYADCFGFTEEEVFAAMDECGYTDKASVKAWYDGFVFGEYRDIYNPWSILHYLDKGKVAAYWANTSSNSLVSKLVREGSRRFKVSFERLLAGEPLIMPIDEQIVYDQLNGSDKAVWSLLVASGYLKVLSHEEYGQAEIFAPKYELALTNLEVKVMFQNMIQRWFSSAESDYNDFVEALLLGDVAAMNDYMNQVALQTFSYFDVGKYPSKKAEPERFYHGFVLGLMVELQGRYVITSNRQSGFGRYDVMLEPVSMEDDGIIIEFKVHDPRKAKNLEESLENALKQIEEKRYDVRLMAKGIAPEKIRKYGFVFEGKRVLIG